MIKYLLAILLILPFVQEEEKVYDCVMGPKNEGFCEMDNGKIEVLEITEKWLKDERFSEWLVKEPNDTSLVKNIMPVKGSLLKVKVDAFGNFWGVASCGVRINRARTKRGLETQEGRAPLNSFNPEDCREPSKTIQNLLKKYAIK